jgi:arylsulfatase A-like enzyme
MKQILIAIRFLLVLPTLSLGAATPALGEKGGSPPNIVMIVADDMGWSDFGFMGSAVVRTPNLDRLASDSAVFPNGYVPTSLCRASLATILTGMYAHQHKICCNDPPEGVERSQFVLGPGMTVPAKIGEMGYASLQTGKWWEGHYSNGGFTDGMTLNGKEGRHGDAGLVIGRKTMKPAFDFLDNCKENNRPFFVWYAPMMPHTPHDPPKRILDKYRQNGRNERLAKYYAMCEWFDETVGQLLAHLKANDQLDNTLIVFVIDNGWIQETAKENTTRGDFAPRSKLSPYDGGLRTPILLNWPGHTKRGIYKDLISTIDLAPTMFAACGLKENTDLPGLSLLDVAAGNGRLNRDAVFGEIFEHTAVSVDKPAMSLTHRWVREGDWKLIRFDKSGEPPELYNVAGDPREKRNLAKEQLKVAARLSKRIDDWWSGAAAQK